MDTNALRLFVLAAEKLNISAAGRELGLAPAVASAWLAKLETTLGRDLLHRSTRKVSLSLAGAEFLPYARDIIAREDAARAALGLGATTLTGTLRFTAPSSFAQAYIVPLLPAFQAEHTDLTLDLRLSDKRLDLIDGSFDLALRNAALQDSTLRSRKLADDKRILCAAPAYLDAHGTPDTPEDLLKHRFIAFADTAPLSLASPTAPPASFDPTAAETRLIIDDGLSLKRATLAGAGIAVNSLWSVHEELASGALKQVLPAFHVASDTALWLIYPRTNILSAKVRVFMDFLLDRIGRNPPWEAGMAGPAGPA